MMSAMITWLSATRPPPPRPCTVRQTIRKVGSWVKPAAAEAATKSTRASWKRTLRLTRSASLPQIGVAMAVASRAEVMTQV